MESIVDVLTADGEQPRIAAVHGLLGQLMEGRLYDLSLSSLLRENLNLIARKMVERTGHSGEHYIAHNRKEYTHMWVAAIGGGLLTVLTAAIKLRVYDAHLPLFVEGFAAGTNYAVSFITLQIFGLVLATKQPAATAATFAGIIRENRGVERENKLTEFVSRITSTQLAAALGNVFAVSIGALVFEALWRHVLLPVLSFSRVGHARLRDAESDGIRHRHSSPSSPASFSGWRRSPEAGARTSPSTTASPTPWRNTRLASRSARDRMKKISRTLQRNLGGWSTSIVLGYLLGFTPVIGKFFGIPLDVRHVTLSTGTFALSVAHFGVTQHRTRLVLRSRCRHRRHLRPQPVRQLQHRRLRRPPRLRRQRPRTMGNPALPCSGRPQVPAPLPLAQLHAWAQESRRSVCRYHHVAATRSL